MATHCLRFFLCLLLGINVFSNKKDSVTIYCHQLPPGNKAVLFAPELFSYSEGYHSSPVFTQNGKMVFYSKMKENGDLSFRQSENWDIESSLQFEGFYDSGNPFLSCDNSTLYFMSFQPVKGMSLTGEHIWMAEKHEHTWEVPEPVDPCILSHSTHWQFSVSCNDSLYFMSESRDGQNQDIYCSALTANGTYAEPVRLPDTINTPYKEFTPFISSDESYIIFARIDSSTEKSDLFISRKNSHNRWAAAEKLPDTINSAGHDLCPIVSPDGRYLFFLSTRTGISRIYWVTTFFLNREDQ